MTKITTHRFKLPVVIAMAAAMVASAQAATDTRITTDAAQQAQAAGIEDVGQIAVNYAAQMGTGTIKLSTSNVKALAQVLADAIQAKGLPTDTGVNRLQNQADEIGEAAALIADGIVDSVKFKKGATAYTLNLLKGALLTAKKNAALLGNSSPSLFADVAGSVMQTFVLNTATSTKTDKKIFTFMMRNAAKVAGAKNQKAIKIGLKEAFKNPALALVKYEDGNLGPIIDPETDTRNG
jgi:hypothetical protein